MFVLALVYLIILVVALIGSFSSDPRWIRVSGAAQWILFTILGYLAFWTVLNR